MEDKDIFFWGLGLFRCLIHLFSIMAVVVKVDLQTLRVKKLFHDFERSMIEHDNITDALLLSFLASFTLIMDVRDTTELRFTAWLGCIQINRSNLLNYLINLVVYTNLLFGLMIQRIFINLVVSFFDKQ